MIVTRDKNKIDWNAGRFLSKQYIDDGANFSVLRIPVRLDQYLGRVERDEQPWMLLAWQVVWADTFRGIPSLERIENRAEPFQSPHMGEVELVSTRPLFQALKWRGSVFLVICGHRRPMIGEEHD